MNYSLELLCFCFRGGNESEYKIDSPGTAMSSAWRHVVGRMAITTFPTAEPCNPARSHEMAFANLPGEDLGEGVRIHCVYFDVRRGRAFRNVFCFAYRESECTLSALAAVSVEEWFELCRKLSDHSKYIELPRRTPPHDLPSEWSEPLKDILIYHFPDRRGEERTQRLDKDAWEKFLNPPQPPSPGTPPRVGGAIDGGVIPAKIKEAVDWIRRIKILFLSVLLLTIGFTLGHFIRLPGSHDDGTSSRTIVLREIPYGAYCNVCMGSHYIVQFIQCPQCRGAKKGCSWCNGMGEIPREPIICPHCKEKGKSKESAPPSPRTATKRDAEASGSREHGQSPTSEVPSPMSK